MKPKLIASLYCISQWLLMPTLGANVEPFYLPNDFFREVATSYLGFDETRAKGLIEKYKGKGVEYERCIPTIREYFEPVGKVPPAARKEFLAILKKKKPEERDALSESFARRYSKCEYAWVWLGWWYNQEHRPELAIKSYRRALDIAPNNFFCAHWSC
ncbi:MAG: tetratricopeptide repeat protein [Candidatus Melainabacteria bacterium]|nr:tetratricopeptide repeat protein [Candidatus Melainabacteria bacterium]